MEERRQNRRYTFSETAEVVEVASGACLSIRAADLSLRGCYLDSLNTFPPGSNVQVRIRWLGAELTCRAVVQDSQPGMGMGVAFVDLDDASTALIESWIKRLSVGADAALAPRPPSENAEPARAPEKEDAVAVRLIDLLHKKGLLSSNDVGYLLRDRNV